MGVVRRGEIWLAALDPAVGSEIQKTRLCVIVSPSEMHDYLRTVIVAPMTTGSKPAPYRIPVPLVSVWQRVCEFIVTHVTGFNWLARRPLPQLMHCT